MGVIKPFRIKSFKKNETVIEFENVSLSYGNRLILDNINFKINKNSIHGMLGPNGAGKSTIFNLITGLIKPKNGKIKMFGEDVTNYPIYVRLENFIQVIVHNMVVLMISVFMITLKQSGIYRKQKL